MAKRGRKPSSEKKVYFGKAEEQAVVDYINSKDDSVRSEIYRTILKPAFEKMVSSIIRTYKLFIPEEDYEDTFRDTLSFMITKLSCFKPERGTKAYSYCGTICKNYLFYRKSQFDKMKAKFERYDEINETFSPDLIYSPDETNFRTRASDLASRITEEIGNMINNSEVFNITDGEKKVGLALIELINSWEDVIEYEGSNKLNKSAVLYYLREQTLMSTKEVRDNMKKYKSVYLYIKNEISKKEEEEDI